MMSFHSAIRGKEQGDVANANDDDNDDDCNNVDGDDDVDNVK